MDAHPTAGASDMPGTTSPVTQSSVGKLATSDVHQSPVFGPSVMISTSAADEVGQYQDSDLMH